MAEQNTTTTQALLHVNLSLWWTHPNHPSDLDNNQETVNFDNRIHVVDIVLHCIYQGHKKLYTCHQWNSSNNPNTQLNLHQTWIATPNHPCWIPKWYDFWPFFSTLLPLCLHCPHWCTYYTALSTWYQRPDHSLWKYTLTLRGTVGSGYLSSPSPNIHRVPCHFPGLHLHHWTRGIPQCWLVTPKQLQQIRLIAYHWSLPEQGILWPQQQQLSHHFHLPSHRQGNSSSWLQTNPTYHVKLCLQVPHQITPCSQ